MQPSIPSQRRAPHKRQPHNQPTRPLNLHITQLPPKIPDQMPNAIERVKAERQRDPELDHKFRHGSQAAEHFRQVRALEVPAQQGGDEVCGAEDVEAPREDGARDPVQSGGVPCYLRPVDGEVGGYRALPALGGEDFVGGGWFDRVGG